MKKHLPSLTLLTSAITSVILTGCGGGGSGSSSHTSSAISKSSLTASSVTTSSVASNSAPIFTSGSTISVDEGSKTATGYVAIATDSDNDVLTYSLSGGTDKASFAVNSQTGAISFVAAPDFEQPADANHDNIYDVQINVTDAKGGTAAQALQITVKDVSVKLTALSKDSATKIVPGNTLTAQSSCAGCDEAATHYEWFVEGNETPVSTAKTYQVQAADRFKKITIKATPYSTSGEAGNTENIVILRNQVKQFYFKLQEFSALKTDGTFYSWGYNALNLENKDTTHIANLYHSYNSVVVERDDGSVEDYFGHKLDQLSHVDKIDECYDMFAAVDDGDVFTWGNFPYGGDTGLGLSDVVDVECNYKAIAAIKSDGTVVTKGYEYSGGDSSRIDLTNVSKVVGNSLAFAAIKNDKSVVTWGSDADGGDSSGKNLTNVADVVTGAGHSFTAIKVDGTVVSWGNDDGASSSTGVNLTNVTMIVNNGGYNSARAYAAIKKDDSAVVWGNHDNGGYTDKELTNISKIVGGGYSFAALKKDGTVITWGESYNGNEIESNELNNVVDIYGGGDVFAAFKNDGEVFLWGSSAYGGDTPDVDFTPEDMVVSSSIQP